MAPAPRLRQLPKALLRGFSLLEILLVLVIVATILAVVASAASGWVQASAISAAADEIRDAMTEARADAVAQNTTVEMRFYQLPPQSGGAPVYNALQLHWLKADGTSPAAAPVILLSSWVVMDATAVHSPLIGANSQTATTGSGDARVNSSTRVFHFLPDGSTDLSAGTNWFLTVRAASQSDPAHFPANWACVEVDVATGRAQIYRP